MPELKRWRCKERTYWNAHGWDVGEIYDGLETPPQYFEEITGFTPSVPAMLKEREGLVMALKSFGVVFHRKAAIEELRSLFEKHSGDEQKPKHRKK